MINNYIHHNMSGEKTYPFPNFRVELLKFGEVLVISCQILLGKWLLIHIGTKVIPC